MVGRSRPACRSAAARTALLALSHQIRTEIDELSVVGADLIGFEMLPVVQDEPIAHVYQCFVDSCRGG